MRTSASPPSACIRRMATASTTWRATSGNGSATGTAPTTTRSSRGRGRSPEIRAAPRRHSIRTSRHSPSARCAAAPSSPPTSTVPATSSARAARAKSAAAPIISASAACRTRAESFRVDPGNRGRGALLDDAPPDECSMWRLRRIFTLFPLPRISQNFQVSLVKKIFAATAASAAMVFLVQSPIAAQRPAPMRVRATSLSELRQWDAYVTGRARDGQLHLRLADRDPSLPLRTIERFDQFHQGVRIWGADVVRDSERGVPISIFGELAADLSLPVEPSLAAGAAREALLRTGGAGAVLLREPELVIIRLAGGDYRLA